jgi:CelD/BcsL family acetyltransferase involved in cellulose biosynthesis
MRIARLAAMIERIEDIGGFEKLREEWTELLDASASSSLFLTWEWLYTWWKHLSAGRRLCLLTVRSGPELVAIAPLALRPPQPTRLVPFPALEFLGMSGIVASDYLDFIVRRGKEQEALQALAESLTHEGVTLELAQLTRGFCLAAALAAQLMPRGWRLWEAQTDVCPFIKLSEHTWQSYLATLGPEHRYNFQRRLRNLTKEFDVRFEQALTEEQRRESLALLLTLHNMRWRDRGGSNAFHAPSLQAFHEELSRRALERGWLRLFILRLDGQPAAALYGFRYRRTFYFYQSGFDPKYSKYSVGLVALGLTIKYAIEEGAEDYDLLQGGEPYKFQWARETRELARLELYPPHLQGFLCKGAAGLSRTARRMARRVLPKALIDKIATGRVLPFGSRRYAAAAR